MCTCTCIYVAIDDAYHYLDYTQIHTCSPYRRCNKIELFKNVCFYIYSKTCIKMSPLGQRKSGLLRQMTSKKRFNSYENFYDRSRKRWPLNTGLTVHLLQYTYMCTCISVTLYIYVNLVLYICISTLHYTYMCYIFVTS